MRKSAEEGGVPLDRVRNMAARLKNVIASSLIETCMPNMKRNMNIWSIRRPLKPFVRIKGAKAKGKQMRSLQEQAGLQNTSCRESKTITRVRQ